MLMDIHILNAEGMLLKAWHSAKASSAEDGERNVSGPLACVSVYKLFQIQKLFLVLGGGCFFDCDCPLQWHVLSVLSPFVAVRFRIPFIQCLASDDLKCLSQNMIYHLFSVLNHCAVSLSQTKQYTHVNQDTMMEKLTIYESLSQHYPFLFEPTNFELNLSQ